MTQLVNSLAALMAVVCLATNLGQLPGSSSPYFIRPMSNSEMAEVRGGDTPARYCYTHPSTPKDDVECEGESTTERDGICGRSTHWMYPEQCVNSAGNEYCEEEFQEEVVLTQRGICVWKQDGLASYWYCTEDTSYECCETINTSISCYYETGTNCGTPAQCQGQPPT